MKSYQNTSQTLNKSSFTEIGTYSGANLDFDVKRPIVKVGGQEVNFAKGSISLRTPHAIVACGDTANCVIGTVTESLTLNFNVVGLDSLDVLKVEVDRIFALTKIAMIHGVLPPVYSSFTEE